jgi:PadR family transcriptional regulator, regulatory protein AphA
MAASNTTGFAVLGMLSAGPRSGYDIKKAVDSSIAHFWSESFGQIYPILRLLTADGFVRRRHEAQRGKPDRQVYSITPRGHEALRAWLGQPARPESFRSELLLKLFLGAQVPASVSLDHVRQFRERQEALLTTYSELEGRLRREHAGHPELPYWLMTLHYGQRRAEALRDWAVDAARTLAKGAPKETRRLRLAQARSR